MSFDRALEVILYVEGGYSNHPADPGGATMKGITQRVYNQWRGATDKPVHEITDAEVRTIYHDLYWLPSHSDELPWPLAMVQFDGAVNHGTVMAVKILQRSLGLVDDGIFGPVTRHAAEMADDEHDLNGLLWERLKYYHAICRNRSSMRVFLTGWLKRILHVRDEALGELENEPW